MNNVRTWLAEKSTEEREQFLGEAPRLCLEGGRIQKFCRLLRDFDFIEAKINHPQFGLPALIDDYELIKDSRILNHPDDNLEKVKVLRLIQGALKLSAHILAEDKTQLAAQLWGRLQHFEILEIEDLLKHSKQSQASPWLRPQTTSLTPPGGRLLYTLIGHNDWVTAVTVTPDGKRIISGSSDNTVKVWDLATGAEILTFSGHNAPVAAVIVTPNSKWVISGSFDNTIKVWNLATGAEFMTLCGHTAPVIALTVTPDNERVISTSVDKTIKVWNLKIGEEQFTLNGHTNFVRSIVVTSNGKYLISGSDDKTIKVWCLKSGKKLFSLNNFEGEGESAQRVEVYAVAVKPDGKCIISGSSHGTIRIWDLETGKKLFTLIGRHKAPITAIAVTPDGKQVISASLDKELKVWSLESYEQLFTLTGHLDSVDAVHITPDSRCIVSGSRDKTLKLWVLKSDEENASFTIDRDSVCAINITSDGQKAISTSKDNILTVWDLENLKDFFNLSDEKNQNFLGIIIKNLIRIVVIIGRIIEYTVELPLVGWIFFFVYWHLIFSIIIPLIYPLIFNFIIVAFICLVFPVLILTYGLIFLLYIYIRLVIRIGISEFLRMIGVKDNRYLFLGKSRSLDIKSFLVSDKLDLFNEIYKNYKRIDCIAVNNRDRTFFIIKNKILQSCDLRTTHNIFYLQSISERIYSFLVFLLMVCFLWMTIDFFDYNRNLSFVMYFFFLLILTAKIRIMLNYVTAFIVTQNGNNLIFASKDKTIKVWNLKIRKQHFILKGHRSLIKSLAINPDSKYLISGSRDKTIKVWNLENRKQLFTLKGHTDSVNAVAITPNSKWVISASSDNTVKVWDLESREELYTFKGHKKSVNAITLSPNGKQVISISSDKTLQVWDLETQKVIAKFIGDDALLCCAVAPDGATILAGSEFGKVHFLRFEKMETWLS